MRKILGRAGAWMLPGIILLTGCTTNIYHVMKAENHYYIVPLNDLPAGGEEDEWTGSAMPVLTRGQTNSPAVPGRTPLPLF